MNGGFVAGDATLIIETSFDVRSGVLRILDLLEEDDDEAEAEEEDT